MIQSKLLLNYIWENSIFSESSNSEHRKKVRNEISEEIAKALNFYESPDMEMIPFPETLTNKKQVTKKAFDKFTQTFFKYMKNLSNRRTMEIIKKNVDHSDESLIFFCSENNLPFTFKSWIIILLYFTST